MSGYVLITVPHAACPARWDPSLEHPCDLRAPAAAKRIFEELRGPASLLESEIHRDPSRRASDGRPGSDQNRPWGRTSVFRREFLRRLPSAALVLDVHSFPRGGFGGRADFAVLEVDVLRSAASARIARAVGLALGPTRRVARIAGSVENWIVVRAQTEGIPGVLLEFGEHLADAELDAAARAIARTAEALANAV